MLMPKAQLRREDAAKLPRNRTQFILRESRQSLPALTKEPGEESLDFTGADTGERPGAVRLRKVQQKTYRSP
jgi:hypothetical protein